MGVVLVQPRKRFLVGGRLFASPYHCGARVKSDGAVVIRGGKYRESELPEVPPGRGSSATDGRCCISVIGIDRYRRWNRLDNAVSDARGVLAAFEALGFVSVVAPLLDDAATGDAIRRFPAALSSKLDPNDSLIVFFAGHGHTRPVRFPDGLHVSTGYLIPVDADTERPGGYDDTWQRLDHWLTPIAELPPRHILVILDSCRSGIALSHNIQHRGVGVRTDGSSIPFHERRSRRVFTSALDDQGAMDGGPIAGHSVFTGCLIEALRGAGSMWSHGSSMVSMSEIAAYVGRRVREQSDARQVPGLGVLEFDDCGELFLALGQPRAVSSRIDTCPACHQAHTRLRRRPTSQSPLCMLAARSQNFRTAPRGGRSIRCSLPRWIARARNAGAARTY